MAYIPRSQRIAKRSRDLAGVDADVDSRVDARSDPVAEQAVLPLNKNTESHGSRRKQRKPTNMPTSFEDFPALSSMKPVLIFFLAPVLIGISIMLTGGGLPWQILYPAALLMGAYVAYTTLNGLELVVACLLLYLPFSTTHAIAIAPGINGTNMLLLLGLGGAFVQAYKGRGWFIWLPGTALLYGFGMLSALSGFTTLSLPGGYDHLVYNELLNFKGWLEQFLFIFILHCAIRDREMAKRMVIYMGLASVALLIYVIPELFEKLGRSTIEKSRIEGPHKQANNFGGFVAYTLMPPLAIFVVYMQNLKAWIMTPYFLLAAKILISTFSRGAYLAMALGALCIGYFRGKAFLFFWASLALVFVLIFPQIVPESIMARMQSSSKTSPNHNAPITEDQLDASSRDRLILWRAAVRITIENPVTGLGFKSFPIVKDDYTDVQLFHVSDPHSMYLSLAAEMGIPVLSLFLLILFYACRMGLKLSHNRSDQFVRAIGIGGIATSACYTVICIFGSRAVNLEFSAFFWTLFVVMQVLLADPDVLAGQGRTRKKRQFPLTSRRSRALDISDDKQSSASVNCPARSNAFTELKKSSSGDAG